MPNISQDDRDKSSPVWDMSQERAFMETLSNQRLNFFLIIFSIVVAGSVNSKSQLFFQIILGCGFVLCSLLAWTIFRGYQKLGKILNHLKADETHPVKIIDIETPGPSVRRVIGYIVPMMCCFLLLTGFILSLAGILKVESINSNSSNSDKQIKIENVITKCELDSVVLQINHINTKIDSLERKVKRLSK